jgi:uncharacterized membrane protein YdjX (TVP38/TMEM64 family)
MKRFRVSWRPVLSLIWLAAGLTLLLWLFSASGGQAVQFARTKPVEGLTLGFFLVLTSQILAPLSGFAIVAGMAKVYGLPQGLGVLYLCYITSFAANFWIARRFGRPAVRWVLGGERFGRLAVAAGQPKLVYVALSRMLGYYYNDAISYVWGVTSIRFWPYYGVSLASTSVPALVEYLILRNISLTDASGLGVFYIALFLLSGGLLLTWRLIQGWRSSSLPPV